MTTFVQLFSTGGFGFLETLGLLGQGGLILTVIRTLQNTGQEKIKALLNTGMNSRFRDGYRSSRVSFVTGASQRKQPS